MGERLSKLMTAVAAALAAIGASSCSQPQTGLILASSSPTLSVPTPTAEAPVAYHGKHSPRSVVPGACSEPASANAGRPGCYMAAEITIESPPASIYWNVYSFPSAAAAAAGARAHDWSVTTQSHGLYWAHVLAPQEVRLEGGRRRAVVGPMALTAGRPIRARFIESFFLPGMRTSVHSHPGPEGFYVLDGAQCMDMPSGARQLRTGETMIVPARSIHFQSAPIGRRNVAVVFYPPDEPWMKMETGWKPSEHCKS